LTKGCILQWYPGHIAKAEKELKSQIKLMDVIIEVRDARAPMATTHPEVPHYYFYLSLLVYGLHLYLLHHVFNLMIVEINNSISLVLNFVKKKDSHRVACVKGSKFYVSENFRQKVESN
jgi:hypothetical protein